VALDDGDPPATLARSGCGRGIVATETVDDGFLGNMLEAVLGLAWCKIATLKSHEDD
jgi:hypothetical protein